MRSKRCCGNMKLFFSTQVPCHGSRTDRSWYDCSPDPSARTIRRHSRGTVVCAIFRGGNTKISMWKLMWSIATTVGAKPVWDRSRRMTTFSWTWSVLAWVSDICLLSLIMVGNVNVNVTWVFVWLNYSLHFYSSHSWCNFAWFLNPSSETQGPKLSGRSDKTFHTGLGMSSEQFSSREKIETYCFALVGTQRNTSQGVQEEQARQHPPASDSRWRLS